MATVVTPERTLEAVKKEYIKNPFSPEYTSEFDQAFFYARKRQMRLSCADLVVPQCPYTEVQLRSFMEPDGDLDEFIYPDGVLYVPEIISTAPEGIKILRRGWPEMGDGWPFRYKRSDKVLQNYKSLCGHMITESVLDAPYPYTKENEVKRIFEQKGREGQTLNIYIVASNRSKELYGKYFDEDSRCRILSSHRGVVLVEASFERDGRCKVEWPVRSMDRNEYLGARSVLLAKT